MYVTGIRLLNYLLTCSHHLTPNLAMDDIDLNLFAVILLVFAGHLAGVERAMEV